MGRKSHGMTIFEKRAAYYHYYYYNRNLQIHIRYAKMCQNCFAKIHENHILFEQAKYIAVDLIRNIFLIKTPL